MNGEIGFVLIAALLAVVALMLVLPVFFGRHGKSKNARHENITAARERLRDLRARAAADDIAPSVAAEYEREIEDLLLQDAHAPTDDDGVATAAGRDWLGAGLVAAALLVATPLLYASFGSPQALSPPPSMDEVAEKLARRLAAAPQDAQALAWMGRVLAAQEQYADAAVYYARARAVVGDTPDLLAANINALLLSEPPDTAQIDSLLRSALEVAPAEPIVWWLAGLRAEQDNRPQDAIKNWRQALALMPDDAPQRAQLLQVIADAERTSAEDQAAPADGAAVRVAVVLGEGVVAPPTAALFIFAKTADGSLAMPLAAMRRQAKELPLVVVLDDRAAMAAVKMSNFSSYQIVARISRRGTAQAAEDDLWGRVDQVGRGDLVTVVIDQTGFEK